MKETKISSNFNQPLNNERKKNWASVNHCAKSLFESRFNRDEFAFACTISQIFPLRIYRLDFFAYFLLVRQSDQDRKYGPPRPEWKERR